MALKNGVLILVAHADDTEFLAGGAVARFAAEGHEIVEAIATDNSRGTFELTPERIIGQSREEAREAARILGKKEVVFLDYSDGMLSDTPLNELREKFMRLIRRYRPRIVMTLDPFAPFETHPDHRQVALAATEAVAFGHMPLFHPEHRQEGLEPHLVAETYFFAKDTSLCNKYIDIGPFIEKKIEALCAHDSQMKLTIDDLRLALVAIGAKEEVVKTLDRNNYQPLIDLYARIYAKDLGRKAGCEYAEAFRCELAGGPVAALARGV
jgi:LmbE family N-acetylglucosaminyl deacetylase